MMKYEILAITMQTLHTSKNNPSFLIHKIRERKIFSFLDVIQKLDLNQNNKDCAGFV